MFALSDGQNEDGMKIPQSLTFLSRASLTVKTSIKTPGLNNLHTKSEICWFDWSTDRCK